MTTPGPRSGDDTYDLIGDARYALAEDRYRTGHQPEQGHSCATGTSPGRRHQMALRPQATQHARRGRLRRSAIGERRPQWTKGPGALTRPHTKPG